MITKWLIAGLLLLSAFLGYGLEAKKRELAEFKEQVAKEDKQAANERTRNLVIQVRNNERIAENDEARQKALRVELAAAESALERMRRDNAKARRDRPVPTASNAAALADEAATARDLLQECSARYQQVDGEAKSMGAQLIGLQSYVVAVCQAGSGGQQDAALPAD
jgi:hypothetical protein